jgi:hypothetical protein
MRPCQCLKAHNISELTNRTVRLSNLMFLPTAAGRRTHFEPTHSLIFRYQNHELNTSDLGQFSVPPNLTSSNMV